MRTLARRGFTLVELALSLTLLGLVSALCIVVVLSAARPAARATTALFNERTVRSLANFLSQELRDARADDVTSAPAQVTLPRPIAEALVCADDGDAVRIADTAYTGTRGPEVGRDQLTVLTTADDTAWQALSIAAVTTDACPDGAPAVRLGVPSHVGRVVLLRVWEPVEVNIYRSGVADWFGLTPADHDASVQPFAGPLVPGGSRFDLRGVLLEATIAPEAGVVSVLDFPLIPGP